MFDIRMGEFRRVWLMQLNVFLLIQCLWIIKPIANAQFLSTAGIDKLPSVFLLVAVCALAVATSYSRLLRILPLGTITIRTYMTSIILLLICALFLHLGLFRGWMSYCFYIGVALFGLITTSQFWLLGNLVFSSLEAKRLFGILGAGAIAGGISGGYVTSVLAPWMDNKNLLFVAAGILLISLVINQHVWKTYVPAENRVAQGLNSKTLNDHPLRQIIDSKHLTFLALIIGISVVVAKLVEFQFSAIASTRFKDPDQLTAFFGFWFSTSNVVSLGIQLLITQRLLARIGVGRSLFILPGALFAGAATVLYTPVLWAGTTIKLFDISLKQSINKAATELLIVPIPLAVKTQAKTFIDIFVDTTATGVGGILLIFLINGFNLSVRAVSIMILLLIVVWIYFAIRVRKEYVLAFEKKLGIGKNTTAKNDFQTSRTPVVEGVRRTLEKGSTNQILYLLGRIEESKDPRLMPHTIPLLKHPSPLVRQAAVRCLYYHSDHTITSLIQPLLNDPDEEVRSRAFSTLLAQTRNDRVHFIRTSLNDPDPAIRGAALVGLATEACDNPVMQRTFHLNQLVQDEINRTSAIDDPDKQTAHKIVIARTIGYGRLSSHYNVLLQYLQDDNPAIREQAIVSSGKSQHPNFIKPLLSFLEEKTTRPIVIKALSRYPPAILLGVLTEICRDKNVKTEILLQMPSLAEALDTQQAVDFLFDLVNQHDQAIKTEALESLHKVKIKFKHLNISSQKVIPLLTEDALLYRNTLAIRYAVHQETFREANDLSAQQARQELLDLLDRRLDVLLERIFCILGLAYPPGIIIPLRKDLRSQDSQVRINTLELLDNILEPAIKKIVMPILESTLSENITYEEIIRMNLNVPAEHEYLETLLKGDDDLLKIAVLALIEALDVPEYKYIVSGAILDTHLSVRSFAEKILMKV